jgi:hypothetical protein
VDRGAQAIERIDFFIHENDQENDFGGLALDHQMLSACAEDHELCPWMNAQNIAEYFTHRSIAASADFAAGG